MNEKDQKTDPTSPIETEKSALERFSETSSAAKLSGKIHETAGFLKQKFGEITNDSDMEESGRSQRLLGKVHGLVGELRELRELTAKFVFGFKSEGTKILRKHTEKLVDQASELLTDIKKSFRR